MKIKGDGWTADPPVDALGLPLRGMTQQEKLRLRRLVTDLEPFTEALQRAATFLEAEAYALDCAADRAHKELVEFIRIAKEILQR